MKIKYTLVILIVFGLFLSHADAGSFYNSRGFGEIKYFSNAQAIGLGGTLIAIPDLYQINMVNPATLVFIPITRLSGDFVHEAIWNRADQGNGFVKYTNLNGVSFAMPLIRQKLTTAFGIIPGSQYNYDYRIANEIDDYKYDKVIKASGGLNKVSFGLGYAPTDYLAVGSYFQYNFGKLEQTWMVDYASDLFWDSIDKLTRKMWGVSWTAGIIVRPVSNLYLGATYTGKYKLNVQDHALNYVTKGSLIFDIDQFDAEKKKMNLPEFLGFGASYILKKKYRISSDFVYQPWKNFSQKNNTLFEYNDEYRVGIGVERLPTLNLLARYHEQMSYRIGYYYHQLNYVEDNGNAITEYGITAGLGFPYYGSFGRIDLAFRYGKRGSLPNNLIEENIFQMFISVTGGERWFYRGGN